MVGTPWAGAPGSRNGTRYGVMTVVRSRTETVDAGGSP